MFQVTRVFADAQGESHFDQVAIPLKDAGEIGRLSEMAEAKGVLFRENDPSYDFDWHHAPRRQYVILLDGEIEIEVSDGEKRAFRGGDVLLVEDTHGKGHRTRTTNGKSRRSIFVALE